MVIPARLVIWQFQAGQLVILPLVQLMWPITWNLMNKTRTPCVKTVHQAWFVWLVVQLFTHTLNWEPALLMLHGVLAKTQPLLGITQPYKFKCKIVVSPNTRIPTVLIAIRKSLQLVLALSCLITSQITRAPTTQAIRFWLIWLPSVPSNQILVSNHVTLTAFNGRDWMRLHGARSPCKQQIMNTKLMLSSMTTRQTHTDIRIVIEMKISLMSLDSQLTLNT